jgi:hypothetical protein
MAESLLRNTGMNTCKQELGRMGVSQVVEPHPRQIRHVLDKPGEEVRQGDRLKRRTISASADQGVAGLPDPEHQQVFSLLPFQAA